MLYLTRRPGEAVIINNCIEVRVVEARGRAVKLGFTFPQGVTVLREEVYEQVRRENLAALDAAAAAVAGDGPTGTGPEEGGGSDGDGRGGAGPAAPAA